MAETISDFNVWLDNLNEPSLEDIYCLYHCITNIEEIGRFKGSKKQDKIFVSSEINEFTLMLVNENSKNAFLKMLDYRWGNSYGSVNGNYEFHRSMQKEE